MTRQSTQNDSEAADKAVLTIPVDKVCWIIIKAREFDVKEPANIPDNGSNGSDDNMVSVLEDRPNDPVEHELRSFIAGLSEDEQVDLVALAWLGREDNDIEDWPAVREEAAARIDGNKSRRTADYLLGEPLVSDFLEQGLSLFGESCDASQMDAL